MKLLFAIGPKYKVAFVLLLLVSVILIAALMERKYFTDVHLSSTGIYNDRLIPAAAVFYINDNCSQKKMLVDNVLNNSVDDIATTRIQLQNLNKKTDSIVIAFENTFLTEKEDRALLNLKGYLKDFNTSEEQVILSPENIGNRELYNRTYESIRAELYQLCAIQTKVGLDLLNESKHSVSRAHQVTNIQISIALVLSILCQVLILTSRSIESPIRQKHKLN